MVECFELGDQDADGPIEVLGQVVVGPEAVILERLAQVRQDRCRRDLRQGHHRQGARAEPVPRSPERSRDRTQVAQLQPQRETAQQMLAHLGVIEQAVDEVAPRVLGTLIASSGFGHGEARRQAGFQGRLRQDPGREAVQGGQHSVIQGGQPDCQASLPFGVVLEPGIPAVLVRLQALAHPVAELGGGVLRERDGGQARHGGESSGGDQVHDPGDQGGRLARARTGFDEQDLLELGADRVAGVLVDRIHDSPMGGSTSSEYGLTAGSWRCSLHCSTRVVGQTKSNAQKAQLSQVCRLLCHFSLPGLAG